MEIYETEQRQLIKKVLRLYEKWEQAEITDLEFFEALYDIGQKGISKEQEFIEILAEDIQLEQQDLIDDLELKENDYFEKELNRELEAEIQEIKEQREIV
jgi:hypothetical protein